MKRRHTKSPDLSLPLFFELGAASAPEATALSLVESPRSASPLEPATPLDSQNSQTRNVAQFPIRGLDSQNSQTGVAVPRLPKFDSRIEKSYPSRAGLVRIQPRLDPNLIEKVRVECALNRPRSLDLQDAVADGLKLWLRARAESRLDSQNSQTPTCSGSSSSNDLDQQIDLTTTTTTVDSQARSVLLPGFAAAIAELKKLPGKSRHSAEINYDYAWEMYRTQQGIKFPDFWVKSNYQTGKEDVMIDLWIGRKRTEEEAARRAAAAQAEREERQRQEYERLMEEMRIRDEQRSLQESQEDARKEAERAATKEQQRRENAELEKRFEEGLAEGKKPWEIT